jgi:tRNA wybutosine-synthesizing protein 3
VLLDPHKGSSDGISRLRTALVIWLAKLGINANMDEKISSLLIAGARGGLPKRIEWIADILVLPQTSLTDDLFNKTDATIHANVCDIIASVFKCTRIARRSTIGPESPTRDSRACMLLCQPFLEDTYPLLPADIVNAAKKKLGGFVLVRENGISYCFDITRLMFSSGNVSEKARAALGFSSNLINRAKKPLEVQEELVKEDLVNKRRPLEGEVVVDLFCGLGYFTLPVLIHAGAKVVHACDWNPIATASLRANILANNLNTSQCIVYDGDNQLMTLPERHLVNTADRVLLGLIPSSENAWFTALQLLKPSGGWLHVHATKGDEEYKEWAFSTLPTKLSELIQQSRNTTSIIIDDKKYSWRFKTIHLERVKSYAPKVWHLVADVHVC